MTTITAAQVGELRKITGAGMMECKKALSASGGDIEKAIEQMRKSGQAKADRKAGRAALEGMIVVKRSADNRKAVMLEMNSETDFVARDENFSNFAEQVAETALANGIDDLVTLSATPLINAQETVEQKRQALVAKLGENIQLRRLCILSTEGALGTYVHSGKIGVLVDITAVEEQVAKNLAMHIAASNPSVVDRSDVSEELINKEREIFSAQAAESGKPADIIEKMVEGRINKYLDEVSLLGQPFVKDPNVKISQLLKNANATVNGFVRYQVGEGMEKKEDNFVEEVMAQAKSAAE